MPLPDTSSDALSGAADQEHQSGTAQGKPAYVVYGSEQVYCQPFDCRHVQLYGFIFKIHEDNANALLHTCLNAPTGGQTDYRMVAPYALVTFAHMGPIAARYPPDSLKGCFEYDEATVWLLTMALEERHGRKAVDRLAWFVPYIFPELSQALCCGREIYGFPKEYSWPQLPPDAGDPECFTLETVLIQDYAASRPATRGQLMQVRRVDRHANGPFRQAGSLADAMKEILGMIGLAESLSMAGLGVELRLLDYALHLQAPMVYLKQFRDATDGQKACYQAIVEAPGTVQKVHNVALLMDQFELSINQADSHPLCREVGFDPQSPAVGGFYIDFDLGIEPGREIWKA